MWLLLVGCIIIVALAVSLLKIYCRRPTSLALLQRSLEEELKILERASSGTSLLLFPRTHQLCLADFLRASKTTKAEDPRNRLLEKLLHCLQAPKTSDNHQPQSHHHMERLQLLGGALHCRQKGYGDEGCRNIEALSELLEAIHPTSTIIIENQNKELSMGCQESCVAFSGLPFMDAVIEWAILPRDRTAMRACLEGISMCTQSLSKEDTKCRAIALPGSTCWPEEVWTILIQEIIQCQQREQSADTTPVDPSPQVITNTKSTNTDEDARATNSYSETAPLLVNKASSTTATNNNSKIDHDRESTLKPCTTRMLGYLYSLNILVKSAATILSDEKIGDKNNSIQYANRNTTKVELRPGVLLPPPKTTIETATAFTNHQAWIPHFLKRLEDATSDSKEKSQASLCTFALSHLPTLMIRLGRYAKATDLLHHNGPFAEARLQELQLYLTIDCYTREWTELRIKDEAKDGRTIPAKGSPSTVFLWLCEQCFFQGSQLTTTLALPAPSLNDEDSNNRKKKQQDGRKELATACYSLAHSSLAYCAATPDNRNKEFHLFPMREISRLLHLARHLQVLVLEGQCHRVANAIYNLALTLYARESFPKEKGKDGRSVNCRQGLRKVAPLSADTGPALSQTCFSISSRFTAALDKLRKDGNDQNSAETPSLEGIVNYLRKELSELVPELEQILAQAKLAAKKTTTTSTDDGSPSRFSPQDGIQFRIGQVDRQLQTATQECQVFADIQVALCDIPSDDTSN